MEHHTSSHIVKAWLVPAIHVLKFPGKDVDARHKAGHDELRGEGEQSVGHDEHGRVDHISLFGHLAA